MKFKTFTFGCLMLAMVATTLPAQTLTVLHMFTSINNPTNLDGANPYGDLVLSGDTLYGTAYGGGANGCGTIFLLNTNGSGFFVLHTLAGSSDGKNPVAGLLLAGDTLYGTAQSGGTNACGTIFALNTNGSDFFVLHTFTDSSDGKGPSAGLLLAGGTLYGTAQSGGTYGDGTLFSLSTNGSGFKVLHMFGSGLDGALPLGTLVLAGNTLYGTSLFGGTNRAGTVFSIKTNGWNFTVLHKFTSSSDGENPEAGLLLAGNTLYGTTCFGGTNGGNGTVFSLNTDGSDFNVLHTFTDGSDGGNPGCKLALSGDTLYGTTFIAGTVFSVKTNGADFTVLHTLNSAVEGSNPQAGLVLSGNTLYGTAVNGAWSGTVFSLSLPVPLLTIMPSGSNVILTWPTNAVRFNLQSTTNLVSPTVWTPVYPGSVVVNGQNTVTNPITGTQQFYQLSQ
jgi:uncharacterized repeat protein (TIGR03803 family)